MVKYSVVDGTLCSDTEFLRARALQGWRSRIAIILASAAAVLYLFQPCTYYMFSHTGIKQAKPDAVGTVKWEECTEAVRGNVQCGYIV